ncbi:MAG: S8 family serine peptidase [bacterium]|nr:S8 family serine peptidase [bacterium]
MANYFRPMILTLWSLILLILTAPPAAWGLQNVDLIVRFKAGLSEANIDRFLRDRDAERLGEITSLNMAFVDLADGTLVSDAIADYRQDSDVLYAESNDTITTASFPNEDPSDEFDQQWGLNYEIPLPAIGSTPTTGTEDTDINAPVAWDSSTGSAATVIALLDTGIDLDHEDLQDNLWINTGEIPNNNQDDDNNDFEDDENGWNFVNETEDIQDDHLPGGSDVGSHGTHIAGIIGADTNNSLGIAGINWNVQLMILKVLDANGTGTVADAIRAIEYALDQGAAIINASWRLTTYSQALYDTLEDAGNRNVAVVAAAAENGGTVTYPARFNLHNIISVTASDFKGSFAAGIGAAEDTELVDVAAPGLNIFSTVITDEATGRTGGFSDYYWKSGASQAAAFVTGVMGLMRSRNPALAVDEMKNILLGTAFDVDADPSDLESATVSGGRLDAREALQPTRVYIEPVGATINFDPDASPDQTVQFSLANDSPLDWDDGGCDRDIGNIDNNGLFTVKGPGICTISALGVGTTRSDIRDVDVIIREITVTPSEAMVKLGETLSFSASGGDGPYRWWSSNPEVAFINDAGVLEGVAAGSVTVTAVDAQGYRRTSDSITVSRGKKSGNCFIATAAFGSPMEPQVRVLQDFRDRYLIPNKPGKAFVSLYYRVSPPLAQWIAERPLARAAVRILLIPLVLFGSFMVKSAISWGMLLVSIVAILAGMAGWKRWREAPA